MTIPNILTLIRICASPVFFVIFFSDTWLSFSPLTTGILIICLFLIIEATDLFDGHFARKLNQTTDIGKIMDPFADSLSRLTYFLCFTIYGIMPFWIFFIVLYRDLGVSFIRQLIARGGISMAARLSGKIKALVYGLAGLAGVFSVFIKKGNYLVHAQSWIDVTVFILFVLTGTAALWSLADYATALKGKLRQ